MTPRLRAPIVLVHGLFGFDRVKFGHLTLTSYFPGIADGLAAAGNRVLIPALSPTGSISDRAMQLKRFLLTCDIRGPYHIIAHSMGGLDSRYMVCKLGMEDHVLSLTTLGTPHRGSPFADWAVRKVERVVKPALSLLGIPSEGFYDLMTERCRRFDEDTPCVPSVHYQSIAGEYSVSFAKPEWLLPFHIVHSEEGPNDGVVSVKSAQFGSWFEVWPGDHFSLVNWFGVANPQRSVSRNPLARYAHLLERLKQLPAEQEAIGPP